MFNRTNALILVIAIAGAVGGFLAGGLLRPIPTRPPNPHAVKIGDAAPPVQRPDVDGKPRSFDEWRGKLLLVNFWASWCAPCLNEMPLLVKAQADFGSRGLQIVGPALDAPAAVSDSVKRFHISYPVFVGDDEVMKAMEALGNELGALPYSVLIAPDGKVLERIYGGLSAEKLQHLLESHLATS